MWKSCQKKEVIPVKKSTPIQFVIRILVYCLGLLLLAFGVAVSVNSDLGVSPVNSLPYVISQIIHVQLGTCVTVVFCSYIVLQVLILRKDFQIINLLQEVNGQMDTDLPWMLEYIDSFLALPKLEQRKYQMARRMGFPLDWKQLWRMRESDQLIIEDLAKNLLDEAEWEKKLHDYMDNYI